MCDPEGCTKTPSFNSSFKN
ncbi:hypothetical protein [Fibrobacter sp. UWH4]